MACARPHVGDTPFAHIYVAHPFDISSLTSTACDDVMKSSDFAGVAQLVRAPDCGSGGRRFKSVRQYHYFQQLMKFAGRPAIIVSGWCPVLFNSHARSERLSSSAKRSVSALQRGPRSCPTCASRSPSAHGTRVRAASARPGCSPAPAPYKRRGRQRPTSTQHQSSVMPAFCESVCGKCGPATAGSSARSPGG